MKEILTLLLFFFSLSSWCQDVEYLAANYEFKKNEKPYLFGDNVKLRENTNTESKVLSLIKIGEQIEIIEKTDSVYLLNGIESPWYKVKYKEFIGYIVGGLISLDTAVTNNLTYLISLEKKEKLLLLKTRLLLKESDYLENISELKTHQFSIKAYDNRGLNNLESVFLIDYLAESCGINGGGIYLFYDGTTLTKVIDYTQIGDADLYWYMEEYIFPTDKDGVENKILYKREVGETKEYETEWVERKLTERQIEWKDNQLIPKIVADKE